LQRTTITTKALYLPFVKLGKLFFYVLFKKLQERKERIWVGVLYVCTIMAACLEASDYAFVRGVAWGGIMIGFGWIGGWWINIGVFGSQYQLC